MTNPRVTLSEGRNDIRNVGLPEEVQHRTRPTFELLPPQVMSH